MNFLDRLYESLKNYLIDEKKLDVQEVTSYQEDEYTDGYCPTCYHTIMTVIVYYNDSLGINHSYTIESTLSELMRKLK